ncbi:Uncharacterised protein [Klebsiella pneumoniae]|nr:Uncharacterised protein [Klebsiella pneumoniae]
MKILSVRHAALPALLLPLIAAAQAVDEQTMGGDRRANHGF